MLNNGSPFNEHYDGRNSSIPEEYRVMTEQDYMRLKRPEPIKFSFERDEPSPQDDSHHAADQPEKRKVKDKKLSVREWLRNAKKKTQSVVMWMYIPSPGEQQSEVEYELNQEMAPGMSRFRRRDSETLRLQSLRCAQGMQTLW
mgnify:CR=1 FL=1